MQSFTPEKYISALLYNHNCVIIPSLGGIVANYSSAKIDALTHKFSPPSKQLSFNRNLKTNDGLLIHHISSETNCSYPEAEKQLSDWCASVKSDLAKNHRISLDKIGTLFYDNNQNLCFEPIKTENYLKESFGLPEFFANPVSVSLQEKEPEIIPLKSIEKPTVNKEINRLNFKKALRYAAVLLFIPALTYIIWLSFNINNFTRQTHFSAANLNPFTNKICAEYAKRQPLEIHVFEDNTQPEWIKATDKELTAVSFIDKGEPEYSENEKITVRLTESYSAEAVTTHVVVSKPQTQNGFYVIAGCFSVYENAIKLMATLKATGFLNAHIVDENNGLFRVCYEGFSSRSEADKLLGTIKRSTKSDAWILTKNS